MSFAVFQNPQLDEVVSELARAEDLTVVVGAGASMESSLPSWSELIEAVLEQASRQVFRHGTEQEQESWAKGLREAESLLGAAAVVQAAHTVSLDTWIEWALYRGLGAAAFPPGPIAGELARLKLKHRGQVELVTVNYDDLLEEAINLEPGDVEAEPVAKKPRGPARGKRRVIHLHGFSGRRSSQGPLVLSEADYQHMTAGAWQEEFMLKALRRGPCLFVGTSLTDLNLLRYLYRAAERPRHLHAAVFARQAMPKGSSARVTRELEAAIGARWRKAQVRPVFVDHYADVAALVQEIRLKNHKPTVPPLTERAQERIQTILDQIIRTGAGVTDRTFAAAQRHLADNLARLLRDVRQLSLRQGVDLRDEKVNLGLWLVNPEGTEMTNWATSDRAYTTQATLEPVEVSPDSNWVSVQTYCRGVNVREDRDSYSSRWNYVRGLPLRVREPVSGGQLLVGSLTLASVRPGRDSELERMSEGLERLVHDYLSQSVGDLLA